MRNSLQSAFKQIVVPNGVLAVAGLAAINLLPISRYQHSVHLVLFGILSAGLLLAVRLHSLRTFFAVTSLTALALFLKFAPTAAFVQSLATALVACNFALIILVDDAFFDWEAVAWWLGLLVVQWTTFIVALRWTPEVLAKLSLWNIAFPVATVGLNHVAFLVCGILLLGKFFTFPDAVGAGLLWALVSLFGFGEMKGAAAVVACMALSGLVLGISVIERSHWIAYHDELTGLPGRRAFKEALASLGRQYSIAIVDVDFFKKFNDTFGHETGDDVLRKVARHLARVGGGGTAFRFGGEEFAVVFPDTGLEEASYPAEELRQMIEDDLFVVRGPSRSARKRPERRASAKPSRHPSAVKTGVTVSIGLADTKSCGDVHFVDAQEVIAAADKALYQAKHLGRNRVECAAHRRSETLDFATKKASAAHFNE